MNTPISNINFHYGARRAVLSSFQRLLRLRVWIALWFPAIVCAASPTDLDTTFDAGSTVDDAIFASAVQADGEILIGGNFRAVHGALRCGLARLTADGDTDPGFPGSLSGGYSNLYDLTIQTDGRILVAGSFTNINGVAKTCLARLLEGGTIDDSFSVNIESSGLTTAPLVRKLVQDADGKIVIAGEFTAVNQVDRPGLARLNADGSLDESFMAGMSGAGGGSISALALQTNGQVVVVGYFETFNGSVRPYLVRLNDDGSVDESFMDGVAPPDFPVRAVSLQPDGKWIIGGIFSQVGGTNQPGIARLNPEGSVDDSFVSAVERQYGGANTIIVCPDSKILIGGCLRPLGTVEVEGMVRLLADGALDDSFQANLLAGDDIGAWQMQLLSNGKILVSGGNSDSGLPPYFLRLNPDGTTDLSFGNGPAGPNNEVRSLGLQPDGKVILGGRFNKFGNSQQQGIARLNRDGSWDTNYGGVTGTDRAVFAVALDQTARCLVAGEFSSINGVARQGLARLNQDGTVDETFKDVLDGSYGYGYSLGVQSDGKVILGGAYKTIDGVAQTNLARLNDDGTIDTSFAPRIGVGSVNGVYTMALQTDGKVIIGGYFNSANGLPRKNLARLHPNGDVDTTFLNGMAGLSASPRKITLQPDGKVLIGGWFETVNQVSRHGFARLNVDGSVDLSFAAICQNNSSVWAIEVQSDGKILIGGYLRINGQTYYLARLNSDGTLDETFPISEGQPNHEVLALVVQPDTRILAAGDFTIIGQTPCSRIARLMGAFVAPGFLTQPQTQTAEIGSTTDFRAATEGFPPVTYQWYFNGTNLLSDCTNAILHIGSVNPANLGLYTVVISNAGGTATSTPAVLAGIPYVERRAVPGLSLTGAPGGVLTLEFTVALPGATWNPLATVTILSPPEWWFDLTEPVPESRFYRTLVGSGGHIPPLLELSMVPALTLTGTPGETIHVDAINRYGPTDAWFTLDTVTLTNTSQLYFDVTALGQPARLYRLVNEP